MEFTLHRQLKEEYGCAQAETEVPFGNYRIDVVDKDRFIEIQTSPLVAIRDKIAELLKTRKVIVVKPLIARKRIIKLDGKAGAEIERRMSPKRATSLSVFDELVYFTRVFPNRRLTLEAPLISVEELRYPGHGRRRRKRANDFCVEDLRLVEVEKKLTFKTRKDLIRLLPQELWTKEFGTAEIATSLDIHKFDAQRIAYCLRETGATKLVGKKGNALRYKVPSRMRPSSSVMTAERN